MSYDLDLKDPVSKETIRLDEVHHMRGAKLEQQAADLQREIDNGG